MEWVEKGALYATSLGLSLYLLRLLRIAVMKKIPRGFRLIRAAMELNERHAEARHKEHMAAMVAMSDTCKLTKSTHVSQKRTRRAKKKTV